MTSNHRRWAHLFCGFAAVLLLVPTGCGGSSPRDRRDDGDTGDNGPSCTDDCTAVAGQCSAQGLALCAQGADGCYHWGSPVPCQNGQLCKVNACANCASNAECDAESVCASGRCALADGRQYTIEIASVAVPAQDSTGAAWDALGGAPDPFVTVAIDDVTVGTTNVAQDTFSATYNTSFDATIHGTSTIVISIYDQDISVNDTIDSAVVPASSVISTLHAGDAGFSGPIHSGSGTTLTWAIVPR